MLWSLESYVHHFACQLRSIDVMSIKKANEVSSIPRSILLYESIVNIDIDTSKVSSIISTSTSIFDITNPANALIYGPCVTRDHTVSPVTHTRTIPAFIPQPQGVTALWLVLIAPTHQGMARLSWRGWLVTDRYKCPTTGTKPGYGRPSQYQPGSTLITFIDRS